MWRLSQSQRNFTTSTTTAAAPVMKKVFSSSSQKHHSSSPVTNERLAEEIAQILKFQNWNLLLEQSDIPKRLNADVVRTVLDKHQVGDPNRLLNFFSWYERKMGAVQDLNILAKLAVPLCNSRYYRHAIDIIQRMIRMRSSPREILGSIASCYGDCNGSSPPTLKFLIY
ncbi:pentatricopeptide repeat-containing protein At5g61990, mitochondrial-like [Diospyros lotus]|uniref:pentatricopeptide repeat-containing protein At5g61990, mitochondrial-like n=1 Tax=Diospyros lotus TaxID=55363 RepID=UPI0022532F93|nr:pentatricopeptide repeat-containing protein At5g61990, mitochondrial-like [Diospyros lotus]